MICVTHIFKTREKHKAIKTKWRETGPVPKMFSSQCCSIARCSSTKSESSSTLLFRISSLPESLRWAFGIGTSALLVAGLPILPETKRGFKEALDPKRRETTVSPIWGWILGSFGFLGAYGGTNGYLTRIGKTNPVISGFKTPFALFGAVLGGKLCNELSPILFDASGIISRLASYTVDGMIADTIGTSLPDGKNFRFLTSSADSKGSENSIRFLIFEVPLPAKPPARLVRHQSKLGQSAATNWWPSPFCV